MPTTTLAQLADRAQNALNDSGAGTWSQTLVQEWVLEAVREYSIHFPRIQIADMDCSTGAHEYDLPADYSAMLTVEYPLGQDPPQYLKRKDHRDPLFWLSDDYYDVPQIPGEIAPEGKDVAPAQLYISAQVSTGETIRITYHAHHRLDLEGSDLLSVPREHEHLLILFVIWKAFTERLATESQSPDTTMGLLQSLRLLAQRAQEAYLAALNRALAHARNVGGWTTPWTMDPFDRVY